MTEISWESLGNLLLMTIFLSMALVPVASRLAHEMGAVDIPNSRSVHTTPMPRMGGLAISLSLAIACLVFLPFNSFLVAFLSGLVLVVATGLIDDVMGISPRWKFVGQALAAAVFIYLSGVTIDSLGDIVGTGNIELGHFAFAFTVFCFVGGMNAFNLSDGLDGLAGGLTVIAAVFFAFFAWNLHNGPMFILAACLIGSIIGFLRFNCYPARTFMGDNGSLMLGYVASVLVLMLSNSASGKVSLVTLSTVIALPLLDTLFVMARRVRHGRNPFHPDKTHLHHRLIELGLSHPAVVVVMYTVMIGFGLLAIGASGLPVWAQFASLFGLGLLVFGCVLLMQYSQVRYAPAPAGTDAAADRPYFRKLAGWVGCYGKYVGMGILVALILPVLLGPMAVMSRKEILSLFLAVLTLMVFSWNSHKFNKSIFNSTLYLTVFLLLLLYKVFAAAYPSWVDGYIEILAGIALLWVMLKLYFSSHKAIFIVSEFELMVMFCCGFVAFVVLKHTNLPPDTINVVQQTTMLSIPFLLLAKTLGRIYERHNHWIVVSLVCGIAVIGIRCLFGLRGGLA